jgi:hypothetical protein
VSRARKMNAEVERSYTLSIAHQFMIMVAPDRAGSPVPCSSHIEHESPVYHRDLEGLWALLANATEACQENQGEGNDTKKIVK